MKIKKIDAKTVKVTFDPMKLQFVTGGHCDECRAPSVEVCYQLWKQFNECNGGNFQEVKE